MRMIFVTMLVTIASLGCGSGASPSDAGTTEGGAQTACQQAAAAVRTCATDADCVAVRHTTNCCGTQIWIGIRASEKARFDELEATCDRSYPACGCAEFPPMTDDGSRLAYDATAGVTCSAGACVTFSKACGHPCDAGRSCSTCTTAGQTESACALRCTQSTTCTEAPRTSCDLGLGEGLCVDPAAQCSPQ